MMNNPKIEKPKFETQNSKQIQMIKKAENSKRAVWNFEIFGCALPFVSDFDIRIWDLTLLAQFWRERRG